MRVNGIKKQFWLSAHDNELLKDKARKTCLNEVSLIRFLIRGFEPKEKPGVEFYAAMNDIASFSEEINHLAYLLQSQNEDVAECLDLEVKRWHQFQSEIEKRFLIPERSKEWQ